MLKANVQALKGAGAERDPTLEALAGLAADLQELKQVDAKCDRKLDVLIAQMRILLGGVGLLITALIAVFGLLFAT